jgi:TonB-dependent receptor
VIRLSYLALFLGVVLGCLWPGALMAQQQKGTIFGTVTDSSKSVLPGALIEVQGSDKRVVSDAQGQFRITDLAPAEYTLTVSYLGFAPFTTTVKVEGGQEANVSAELQVASKNDQMIVTAERLHGEVEAINTERTADDIVQILPANVITSLPNTNIADAVGRLPSVTLERDEGEGKYVQIRGTEPRLSNVTIDGVHVPSPEAGVRNIKLDSVPSGIVDEIQVSKTLTPNQDGDAIGGSVNLVTKTPQDKPAYTVGIQGGYTPIQNGRTLYGVDGTLGQRFGVNKKLGFLFGGEYDHNNRGIDDLEPGQACAGPDAKCQSSPTSTNFALISTEDFRTYQYDRTRYGFNADVDYNIKPGWTVYLKGLYADFLDYGSTYVYTPNAGAVSAISGTQTIFDTPGNGTGNMAYRQYIRRPDQGVYSIIAGANQAVSSWVFNYQLAVSRGHNYGGQDFATTNFTGPANVQFALDESDPLRPKLSPIDGTNIYDPTAYSITKTEYPTYKSWELDYQGNASLSRTYSVGSHASTFEIGMEGRDAHKTQNENDQYFNAVNTYTMNQVLGRASNPNYYDRFFTIGSLTDYSKIQSLVSGQLQTGFTPDFNKDRIVSDPATWDTSERVWAGYAMDSIKFGKLRFVGGLRIEATATRFNANQITLNAGAYVGTTPVNGNGGYINYLPSIQAQYLIEPNTTLRLSYGRGISRPNFSDMVPSVQVDPNASPKGLVVGNPALLPTKANNYDILIEHYFQRVGILQGGVFYKSLINPIYATATFLPNSDPNFPGFLRSQSINGPSAYIAGLEASWQQRLSILPGVLNGFGVSANYSYSTSRATFPAGFSSLVAGGQGRIDHPALQRQAPNTWNIGLTYDKARFSGRFAVSHNDANIYAYQYVHDPANSALDNDPIVGIKGPLGDQYLYAHTQFDIQGSYRMYRQLEFVASGLNLSNEVFGFYTGSKIYPNQREFYHPTVIIGLRWVPALEK